MEIRLKLRFVFLKFSFVCQNDLRRFKNQKTTLHDCIGYCYIGSNGKSEAVVRKVRRKSALSKGMHDYMIDQMVLVQISFENEVLGTKELKLA